jgi:hypothetical protein
LRCSSGCCRRIEAVEFDQIEGAEHRYLVMVAITESSKTESPCRSTSLGEHRHAVGDLDGRHWMKSRTIRASFQKAKATAPAKTIPKPRTAIATGIIRRNQHGWAIFGPDAHTPNSHGTKVPQVQIPVSELPLRIGPGPPPTSSALASSGVCHRFQRPEYALELVSLRCREMEFLGQRRSGRNGCEGSRTPLQRQNLAKQPAHSGLFGENREISVRTRMLVADAVGIEPVSARRFPANREKNREFS